MFLVVSIAVTFLITPSQNVVARSPEMQVPLGIVKDADGKVIASVADWFGYGEYPAVVLEIDSSPADFSVTSYGLVDPYEAGA